MKKPRIALVLSCTLALCLPAPSLAQGAKVPATLRLDWVPGPHHIGPVLASQRGYYAQEGIELAVRPGKGSGSTIQVVASGSEEFGFADAGAMVLAVSKGVPVIMVANITQLGPNGVITLDRQLQSPKELTGKTIGLVPGESAHVSLQAVAKANALPEGAYRIVSTDASTKIAALLTGKVDAIVGFRFGDFLRAYSQNPNVKIALFSDWGVNVLANGYVVTTATLEKNPELVQRFLRATMRGWQDTIKDPKAGIDALVKEFPETNRRFIEMGLPMVIEHMHSRATKGKPLGWMAEEDWKSTLETMKSSGLQGDRPPGAYYRNLIQQ